MGVPVVTLARQAPRRADVVFDPRQSRRHRDGRGERHANTSTSPCGSPTDPAFMRDVRAPHPRRPRALGADRHAGAHALARACVSRRAGGEGARGARRRRRIGRWLTRASRNAEALAATAARPAQRVAAALGDARDARGRRPTTCARRCCCARRRASVCGDLAGAIDDLRNAVARAAAAMRALRNALGILLADSRRRARRDRRADDARSRLDPAYARAWNNLGNALRFAGTHRRGGRGGAPRGRRRNPTTLSPGAISGRILLDHGDDAAARRRLPPRARAEARTCARCRRLPASRVSRGDIDDAVDSVHPRERDARPPIPACCCSSRRHSRSATISTRRDASMPMRARDSPASLRAAFGERAHVADGLRGRRGGRGGAGALRRGTRAARSPKCRRSFAAARSPTSLDDLRWTNFLLAYQGEDDRALQARYAAIMAGRRSTPSHRRGVRRRVDRRRARASASDSPRRSFPTAPAAAISGAGSPVSTARASKSSSITCGATSRRSCTELRRTCDRCARSPARRSRPSAIAPAIRADALDVLVYPELGMDATSFALAALRLAPVQCAAWGHPVTTGHATIDAFFSCAAMEPADADAHYAERLLRTAGNRHRLRASRRRRRARRARVSACRRACRSSCVRSRCSRSIPTTMRCSRACSPRRRRARLVVFEGRHPALTAKYRARLVAALRARGGGGPSALIVLPQCSHDDYLRINAVCDAMLDTLRWSGGNTSLDALAAGLPIVTLPGRFMRGRQSAGMLSLAGLAGARRRERPGRLRAHCGTACGGSRTGATPSPRGCATGRRGCSAIRRRSQLSASRSKRSCAAADPRRARRHRPRTTRRTAVSRSRVTLPCQRAFRRCGIAG